MLKSLIASVFVTVLVLAPASAQGTVFFSPDSTSVSLDDPAQTNDAAIISSAGVLGVNAGSPAWGIVDFATWPMVLGDDDSDGQYTDSVIGNTNALQLRAGVVGTPTLFDFYFSGTSDMGSAGELAGVGGIEDAELFRVLPGGGVEKFLSKTQLQDLLCTCSNTVSIDINGFAIDPANGDLYLTFTATTNISTGPVLDGGVVRIPSSAFTLDANGNVATVLTMGAGELVLTEAETNAMYVNAGLSGVTDLDGLEIDPAGGTFMNMAGQTFPNLWLTNDDNNQDLTIVSTMGGGSIPMVNGVSLSGSAAFGVDRFGAPGAGNNSISGLAYATTATTTRNVMLDRFPLTVSTPDTVTISVAGATPGSPMILALDLTLETNVVGGTITRAAGLVPVASASWPELIIPLPLSPIATLILSIPSDTPVSAAGLTTWTFVLGSPIGAPIGVVAQAFDPASGVLSTPLVLQLQ